MTTFKFQFNGTPAVWRLDSSDPNFGSTCLTWYIFDKDEEIKGFIHNERTGGEYTPPLDQLTESLIYFEGRRESEYIHLNWIDNFGQQKGEYRLEVDLNAASLPLTWYGHFEEGIVEEKLVLQRVTEETVLKPLVAAWHQKIYDEEGRRHLDGYQKAVKAGNAEEALQYCEWAIEKYLSFYSGISPISVMLYF